MAEASVGACYKARVCLDSMSSTGRDQHGPGPQGQCATAKGSFTRQPNPLAPSPPLLPSLLLSIVLSFLHEWICNLLCACRWRHQLHGRASRHLGPGEGRAWPSVGAGRGCWLGCLQVARPPPRPHTHATPCSRLAAGQRDVAAAGTRAQAWRHARWTLAPGEQPAGGPRTTSPSVRVLSVTLIGSSGSARRHKCGAAELVVRAFGGGGAVKGTRRVGMSCVRGGQHMRKQAACSPVNQP